MLSHKHAATIGYEGPSPGDDDNSVRAISENKNRAIDSWQKRLVPWMVFFPTLLVLTFIFLASLRISKFESFIYKNEASVLDESFISPSKIDMNSLSPANLEYINLYTLTRMEQYSINKRYSQAATITMSTIYSKYLGFFTGMILSIVGAVFIISKLKESSTNFEASLREQIRFKLLSSSPGIIFGILGTTLMIITIIHKGEVNVNDSPLYLNHYNLSRFNTNNYAQDRIDTSNVNQLPDTGRNARISKEEAEKVNLKD